MSVLSWYFLMPKIATHPRFSSELDNLFPMLSWWVLHFLTISSSLGPAGVLRAVQTSVSISCLGSVACGRRGFLPVLLSPLWQPLQPFSCILLAVGLFASPSDSSSQGRDVPWQDPTTMEDLCTGCLTESAWLYPASNTSFWGVVLQLIQKVKVGFGF